MNPVILAGILKNIYSEFDMNSFSDRLRLQKTIYLLKANGIDFGYKFDLYLYGPYSKGLTKDGFQMMDLIKFSEVQPVVPIELKDNFLKFIKNLKDRNLQINEEWLEIMASYIYLRKNFENLDDEQIFILIKEKRKENQLNLNKIKEVIKDEKSKKIFI